MFQANVYTDHELVGSTNHPSCEEAIRHGRSVLLSEARHKRTDDVHAEIVLVDPDSRFHMEVLARITFEAYRIEEHPFWRGSTKQVEVRS